MLFDADDSRIVRLLLRTVQVQALHTQVFGSTLPGLTLKWMEFWIEAQGPICRLRALPPRSRAVRSDGLLGFQELIEAGSEEDEGD